MKVLLKVDDLSVSYESAAGDAIPAISGVSFTIDSGEAVGLLGESGCGKTTTALSLLRLLPFSARITGGQVRFQDSELLGLPECDMERIRGAEISLILQEPALALNPVISVGQQIAEVIHAHRPWRWSRCRDEARTLLGQVRLTASRSLFGAFPHELSGGQRRRVLIAQALACRPALIIADEPTSGLDTRTQAEILDLLLELKESFHTSFLFVSHNPAVLAKIAGRLLVMYSGRIVEQGGLRKTYQDPQHPYTGGLLRSMPVDFEKRLSTPRTHLSTIGGTPPDMNDLPPGCRFAPRCPERMEVCDEREPEEIPLTDNRRVRCFKYDN